MAKEGEEIPEQKLDMNSINQLFDRWRMDLATQIGDLAGRIDRMESNYQGGASTTNTRNHWRYGQEDDEQASNLGRNGHTNIDSNFGSIKMKILIFQGKVDTEAYLE